MQWVEERFGRRVCRETIRAALHRLKLSWKKARKLLGRADPAKRQAFLESLQPVLDGAARDRHLLVYLDEAHIHQDADLGYGWSARGERLGPFHIARACRPSAPSMGFTFTTRGKCACGPIRGPMASTRSTVLQRLRAEVSDRKLIVLEAPAIIVPVA